MSIQLPRNLVRRLRTVFRRCRPRGDSQLRSSTIELLTGPDGLRTRLHQPVPVEYHEPGAYHTGTVRVPLQALADWEGGDSTTVEIEEISPERVQARWMDRGIPQRAEYDLPPAASRPFPSEPSTWAKPGANFLGSLGHAIRCTARQNVRYALTCLQLRGSEGEIAATDGRQLLLQRGFHFPFTEDVLVPALEVFTGKSSPEEAEAEIGMLPTHVAIRLGPWTFFLPIDRESRYPPVAAAIPTRRPETIIRLNASDAAFLAQSLPRMPTEPGGDEPITVDANGQVVIRARGEEDGPTTELVLEQSEAVGPSVRFSATRANLEQALRLGLTTWRVGEADKPVVCREKQRLYVFMPLSNCVLPSAEKVVRIPSTNELAPVFSPPKPRKTPMPTPPSNGHHEEPPVRSAAPALSEGVEDLVAQVELLRTVLLDGAQRASRLVLALKQQRRQTKALRVAMASLRGLGANV